MDATTRSATNLSKAVAMEIRILLLRRDMNQVQLAERIGVNEMWVSRRLRGAQQLDLNDLDRIAAALDVPVYELLPREVRPNAGLVRVAERPLPPTPRCAPDVRSPSIGGVHRRPKARGLAGQPIAA